jgi:hypothetical protein
MSFRWREPRLLSKHRTVLVISFTLLAVVAGIVILNRGSAHASTADSDYSALSTATASGITVMTPTANLKEVQGPLWYARPTADGPNIESARAVAVDVPGMRAWIAKAQDGGVCILAMIERNGPDGPSASCSRDLDNGATMTFSPPNSDGKTYLAGVVHDGVTSVSIEQSNGSTSAIPVTDDAYAAVTEGAITSVTFPGKGTPRTTVNSGGN